MLLEAKDTIVTFINNRMLIICRYDYGDLLQRNICSHRNYVIVSLNISNDIHRLSEKYVLGFVIVPTYHGKYVHYQIVVPPVFRLALFCLRIPFAPFPSFSSVTPLYP